MLPDLANKSTTPNGLERQSPLSWPWEPAPQTKAARMQGDFTTGWWEPVVERGAKLRGAGCNSTFLFLQIHPAVEYVERCMLLLARLEMT